MMISKRFIVYLAVGVVCAAVDIGLMKLFMFNGVNYLIAATVGFVAGLILNFFLHTWVTFNAQYSHSAFGRYLVVVFANYILTLISIAVFQYLVDMPVLGKLISLPVVAVNGFLLIKYWVHR
ncbi:GtrA family protein [Venatoribacter cucullus]|nr:GtrA family protein [Venatoribacter cucullus]